MSSATSSGELSKTERRRISKAKKKAQKLEIAAKNGGSTSRSSIPSEKTKTKKKKANKVKITKEERKEKYTKIARDRSESKQKSKKEKNLICFNCREKGHSSASCPKNQSASQICFRCGSTEHRLDNCPKGSSRSGSLPFATCFICNEKGHLSSQCPQNDKGIFINGGCCKICQGVDHVESKCPVAKEQKRKAKEEKRAVSLHADLGDLMDRGGGGDEIYD